MITQVAEFQPWPKIPRGSKGETITITEKMDGTNACIIVAVDDETGNPHVIGAQSRKRMITPEEDNHGFANYVADDQENLATLGEGYHYGEWYGKGINGNRHLKEGKQLAMFNSMRWRDGHQQRPDGVECVPVLWEGEWDPEIIQCSMDALWQHGINENYIPEGLVVWYQKTRRFEKHTFANSDGKWTR